jgi:poly-gamma-glutamate synthesis protein (capsule biosynthesis protein)
MHPHVLQGIEYIERAPVFYSIGNFAFPSSNPAARECVMVNLTIGRDGLESVDLAPVEISPRGSPGVAQGQRAHEILAHLDNFCKMFNTQILGHGLAHSGLRSALVYDRSCEVEEERFLGEKSDAQ